MKNPKSIFSVLSDLECNMAEIADIKNLLQLFDENLSEAVAGIDPDEPWTAAHFKCRFDIYYSTLSVIRSRLYEVAEEMLASVDRGHEILRQQREGNEQRANREKTEVPV